jgi:hypothetical protein
MTLSVYLAGSWHDRARLRQYRDELTARGIVVTARWLDSPDDADLAEAAERCIVDIDAAHWLVVLTDVASSSGGFHFETGYALGCGMPIMAVGPAAMLFHHGDWLERHATWVEALPVLTELAEAYAREGVAV